MADVITLDVIDRPAAGALRAARAARRAAAAAPAGLRALIALQSGNFTTRRLPAMTPRRIGLLAIWDGASLDAVGRDPDGWQGIAGAAAAGARDHWHVRGEVTRAAFSAPWRDWTADVEGAAPLDGAEPALILISGDLRLRGVRGFLTDAPNTVAHAFEHPGYLGGLALASSPLNTTSCSAWRTYADARDYAFGKGRHSEAMKRDRRDDRHATEWFLRVRPLASSGTLAGRDPFAGLIAPAIAV